MTEISHHTLYILAQQDICEDGWVKFQDSFQSTVCVLVVKKPQAWKAAMTFCEKRLGKLMMLDNFGQLESTEEMSISVGEEIVQTCK